MLTDEGGADSFAPKQIQVDIRGLQDFADAVQGELDNNFRSNRDAIIAEHRVGVGFGLRHASADMHIAVAKYHDCLTGAVASLDAYIRASEILIAGVQKVATSYKTAEDLAEARLTDVESSFRTAVAEAEAVESAARQRAIRQQAEREERHGLL